MSVNYRQFNRGHRTLFHRITGKPQPQWMWDMALELRIPAAFFLYLAWTNTSYYLDAQTAYLKNSGWAMIDGTLLEMHKHKYRYIAVPRYSVKYEYEWEGKKYVSTRATTGTPYRNWMEGWVLDTITEAQYLQAIPVLRVGERCTVWLNKKRPDSITALASDANPAQTAILIFLGVFPLLMGYHMKCHLLWLRHYYFPGKKMRVGFPKYDNEMSRPPPPSPPPPSQRSPVPTSPPPSS